jgi:hypothetical protein
MHAVIESMGAQKQALKRPFRELAECGMRFRLPRLFGKLNSLALFHSNRPSEFEVLIMPKGCDPQLRFLSEPHITWFLRIRASLLPRGLPNLTQQMAVLPFIQR